MNRKWFTAPGTGAQTAALDAQQAQTNQQTDWNKQLWDRKSGLYNDWLSSYNALKPTNTAMQGWMSGLAGTGSTSTIPDWMQTTSAPALDFNNLLGVTSGSGGSLSSLLNVPNWQDVQNQVQNAYGVLGNQDLGQLATQRQDSLTADAARRGLLGRGSIDMTNNNALANWRDVQGANLNAQGLLAGMNAGNVARQEANANTMTLADFLNNYNQQQFGNTLTSKATDAANFWNLFNSQLGQSNDLYNKADPQSLLGNSANIGNQYANQAQQYGKIAANNAAGITNLLGSLASLYGGGLLGGGSLGGSGVTPKLTSGGSGVTPKLTSGGFGSIGAGMPTLASQYQF